MPGTEVKPSERDQIYKLAAEGLTQAEIARITHRSPHTIRRIVLAMPRGVYAKTKLAGPRNPPRSWDELSPLGQDCLQDFALFSRVFFVRDIPPWRAGAATKIIDALLDEDQRYILMNTPVGSRLTAGSMPRIGTPRGPGGSRRARSAGSVIDRRL